MCRPDAHALDLGEMRDHFFFRQFRQALELQQASRGLLGEITQIRRLLPRQPDPAHFGIGQFANALGRKRIASQRSEAIEDGRGCFAIQLLIKNRLGQGMKRGFAESHATWPDALDNRGQHGVGFLEVINCFAHGRWLLAQRGDSLAYGRTDGELEKGFRRHRPPT